MDKCLSRLKQEDKWYDVSRYHPKKWRDKFRYYEMRRGGRIYFKREDR